MCDVIDCSDSWADTWGEAYVLSQGPWRIIVRNYHDSSFRLEAPKFSRTLDKQ